VLQTGHPWRGLLQGRAFPRDRTPRRFACSAPVEAPAEALVRLNWLAPEAETWKIPTAMFAVKVDARKRLRLKVLRPGDYYEPEVVSLDQINFRRVPPPRRPKLTKVQALKAIEKSQLRFTRTWDQVKPGTRP
jgi:hypothetical protein